MRCNTPWGSALLAERGGPVYSMAMDKPALARLGQWVAELDYEMIPERSLAAAQLQVLNMVATAHAGARSTHAGAVIAQLSALAPSAGRCTCLASPEKHAPHDAATANAALSMVHDYDDIVWMGHTGHSAVFAALGVAEHERADARAFLTAVVAANEVAGRLGASCLFGPLNGQMWTFIHLAGAAAATAKILRLDAAETTNALAIALAQPNFALQPGFLVPTSKLLAAATPTATGIRAGYFAAKGLTGEATILEDPRGFWSRFSYVPLPQMLTGLGVPWVMQTLTVKTYPGCHYFQTACTAIEQLVERTGPLLARGFRSMQIDTTKLAIEASRFAAEYAQATATITPVNVNFDLALTAAILVTAGQLSPTELDEAWLASHASQLRGLCEQIIVRHDPELTLRSLASMANVPAGRAALASIGPRSLLRLWQRYRTEYRSELVAASEAAAWLRTGAQRLARSKPTSARPAAGPTDGVPLVFPNRITVHFEDGSAETELVGLPVGSLCHPRMVRELEQKVLRETTPALGADGARALWSRGRRLGQTGAEGLDRFAALVRCGPPLRQPA